jgi:hypothetical protein
MKGKSLWRRRGKGIGLDLDPRTNTPNNFCQDTPAAEPYASWIQGYYDKYSILTIKDQKHVYQIYCKIKSNKGIKITHHRQIKSNNKIAQEWAHQSVSQIQNDKCV